MLKKKDTLVIIGNGFDRWQNLDTSYSSFQKYYEEHRDEILDKLGIGKIRVFDNDDSSFDISDVELIYGNPFKPASLDDDFWWRFEDSLATIDAERINAFFGKEDSDLEEMNERLNNAQNILKTAFASWVGSIEISGKDTGIRFGDNCYFINFNYTSTLEKRFRVDSSDIYHIHGEADDPESIMVGHSKHPQEPMRELYDFGGRFRGLYQIETVLYETDKHVENNIILLSMELAIAGIYNYDIKDIYVLGHSLGVADIGYFNFLCRATQTGESSQDDSPDEDLTYDETYADPLSDLHNRIQYTIKRYGNDKTITEEISPEEEEAFLRRLSMEQQERNQILTDDFEEALRESDIFVAQTQDKKECEEVATEKSPRRGQDAMWHITYFSEEDEKRIRGAMDLIGCTNYELISSIDETIKPLVTEKAVVL